MSESKLDQWKQNPWDGQFKIPWNDPDFNRRMLTEHLAQTHDLASRRLEWVDRHVDWLHEQVFSKRTSLLLDLACGPGFYSHRLAKLGHTCHGIDFGPASIEYANQHVPPGADCRFTLGDIRTVEMGGPYDFSMLIYGEMNVFPAEQCKAILSKAQNALKPGGVVVIELTSPDVVKSIGTTEDSEYECEAGLFSENPHRCEIRNHWLEEHQVSLQEFLVTELETGITNHYRSTTQVWQPEEFKAVLLEVGFVDPEIRTDWPQEEKQMQLWTARLPE